MWDEKNEGIESATWNRVKSYDSLTRFKKAIEMNVTSFPRTIAGFMIEFS